MVKLPPDVREFFVRMGRKGGKIGGKKAAGKGAKNLANKRTPEERSEAARKAVLSRWAKAKTGRKGKRR